MSFAIKRWCPSDVGLLQVERDFSLRVDADTVIRVRQIFGLHPEIDGVLGHIIERKLGFPNGPARRFALQHFAIGFSQHLDAAQGIFPIVRAKVEIVQAKGFLEDGRVGMFGNGHEGGVVVPHVMAPDHIRTIREPIRVLVVGGAQQKSCGVDCSARNDHNVR